MYNYYENMEKGLVYSYYIRIVDEIKPYEKITIKNMIEEVLKQYSYENFLYYLCTSKELDFLKKILDKKIDEEDYLKYSFEIKTLNNKIPIIVILDKDTSVIKKQFLKDGFSDYILRSNIESDIKKLL